MKHLSRREFVNRGAAAGAAFAASPILRRFDGREASSGEKPRHAFALGVASYTFREFSLEAALAMTTRVGLSRISIKDVHLPLDSPDLAVAAAVRRIRDARIVPYACGVVYMKTPAEVERAFAYAKAGGMEIITGVPDHGLIPLAEKMVQASGIKLAVHNHGPGDPLYPTPQSVYDRVKGLDPRLGLCLDIGHSLRSGVDPAEAAEACGDRLLDVHLKDVTAASREGGPVEMGRGVLDIPGFLRALVKIGYAGTASFEYEKDGEDPLPGLSESVGYVRGALAVL
jgi:inosose dehydratase